jgi:DNA-binding PadR family transcriptional regulator
MGRGLSETQRRILIRAQEDADPKFGGQAMWLDGTHWKYKPELAAAIRDRPYPEWTAGDRASVSRALRRLEARGLIVRIPVETDGERGRRTSSIRLTPEGREVVRRIKSTY